MICPALYNCISVFQTTLMLSWAVFDGCGPLLFHQLLLFKLSFTNFTLSLASLSTFCLANNVRLCSMYRCTVLWESFCSKAACGASTVSACATDLILCNTSTRVAPKAAVFIVFFIKYFTSFLFNLFSKGMGLGATPPGPISLSLNAVGDENSLRLHYTHNCSWIFHTFAACKILIELRPLVIQPGTRDIKFSCLMSVSVIHSQFRSPIYDCTS